MVVVLLFRFFVHRQIVLCVVEIEAMVLYASPVLLAAISTICHLFPITCRTFVSFRFDALNNISQRQSLPYIILLYHALLKREHAKIHQTVPFERERDKGKIREPFKHIQKEALHTNRNNKLRWEKTQSSGYDTGSHTFNRHCFFFFIFIIVVYFKCIFRPPFVHYAVCTGLNINSVNFLILWHSISHFKKATGLLTHTHNVVSRMEYHSKKHDNNYNTLKQKLQVLDRHSLGINETISCHLNSMGLKPFFPKHIHSFLMRQQNTFLLCVNWLLCVRFNYSTSCPSEGRRMD